MNGTMTAEEVKLATRMIGLRGTSLYAQGNLGWTLRSQKDKKTLLGLVTKKHATKDDGGWKLTPLGIQQLKQQIGEFHL